MISVYLDYISIDVIGHHDQGNFLEEDIYLEFKALEKHDEFNRVEGEHATGAVTENSHHIPKQGTAEGADGVGKDTGNSVWF